MVTYTEEEFTPPPRGHLLEQVREFLRTSRESDYYRMKREGTLEEELERRVDTAIRYAGNLTASGEWEVQAWNRAIRLVILESETD